MSNRRTIDAPYQIIAFYRLCTVPQIESYLWMVLVHAEIKMSIDALIFDPIILEKLITFVESKVAVLAWPNEVNYGVNYWQW